MVLKLLFFGNFPITHCVHYDNMGRLRWYVDIDPSFHILLSLYFSKTQDKIVDLFFMNKQLRSVCQPKTLKFTYFS